MTKPTEKEKALAHSMKTLGLTYEEAEELWAFDNEEIENEVVNEIEAKVGQRQVEKEKRSSIEKVKHMKAKIKSDANKENIIDDIFNKTQESEHVFKCQEMTSTKMSFMDKDGFYYTVQVTKHKSKPDGYGEEQTREIKK